MTNARFNQLREVRTWLAGVGLLCLSACGTVQPPPTAQSIAGLTPLGTVTLTETVAAVKLGGNDPQYQYLFEARVGWLF